MRALAGWITRLNRILATVAGLLCALITIIVCLDVASRTLANRSIPGASELAVVLLVALVFLGFAGAESKGDNFSVTLLVDALKPRTRPVLQVVASLLSLAAVALLAWFSWSRGIASTLSSEASYGTISFPVWPSRLLIAFGLTMLALQIVARLLHKSYGDEGDASQ